jgi:hypothetical protein
MFEVIKLEKLEQENRMVASGGTQPQTRSTAKQ